MDGTGAYLGLTCRCHHRRRCFDVTWEEPPKPPAKRSRHRAAYALGFGVKGIATRPLDGGELTLGRARAPARAPAVTGSHRCSSVARL